MLVFAFLLLLLRAWFVVVCVCGAAAPFFVGLTTPNASGGGVGESRSLTTLVNATTLAVDRYELLGLDAFLTCNISARPAPRFEWRNAAAAANGALIHTSRKHMLYANVLRFKSFDKNDIGNYTCTASNGIGQPLHVRFSLNRAGKSQTCYFVDVAL